MKDTKDKDLALKGMHRAAAVARERAARFGLQIPVWRDGAIVFVSPNLNAQQGGVANSSSAPLRSAPLE